MNSNFKALVTGLAMGYFSKSVYSFISENTYSDKDVQKAKSVLPVLTQKMREESNPPATWLDLGIWYTRALTTAQQKDVKTLEDNMIAGCIRMQEEAFIASGKYCYNDDGAFALSNGTRLELV